MIKESAATSSNFFAAGSDIKNFLHLFSKVPIGIAIYTGPSLIVGFANETLLETWGKKREEVLGKPLFEIFPEWIQSDLSGILDNVYTKKEKFIAKEHEIRFIKNGEIITGYFDFVLEPGVEKEGEALYITAIFTEITEDVQNRKKIKESEERFRSLTHDLPLFVWVTDENLRTTYMNKSGLDYFDLAETTDFSTLSWKSFIHPDDIDRILEIMFDAAKKNLSYSFEMRLKDGITGTFRWFLDTGVPRYNKGQFTGFIGTSLDIQDRKEAEKLLEDKVRERTKELDIQNKLLKKQNDLVKKIFDSTLDLVTVYDKDLCIITVNQSALDISGKKEEEVIGKKLTDVFPLFTTTIGNKDLLRALDGETVHHESYQSSLTGKYYESVLIPLQADDNKVYAVLALAHDNTILINKNNELNEVQQIAQLGSWDWNPDTNEVNWSGQMYHIYGYKNENFPVTFEKAVERMLPEDAVKIGLRMNENFAEAKRLFNEKGQAIYNNPPFEYPIFLPDGSKKILRGAGKIMISGDGKVSRMIGTVLDITENMHQVEELKKLNESDKLKSDFIRMANHELKTPVTSIKGYVQLLLAAMEKEETESEMVPPLLIKSSLVSIDKQITRLTRLMYELLDLSKIESGKLELKKELFSINELVDETVQDVLYTNPKHTITIFHDFDCIVYCDKDRIGQALINFLTNAIKYSPKSDKVEVVIAQSEKNTVSVSVKDYGIGIDKAYHDKIFERFYRAEGKVEQTFPGFGIGLFIAKEIIQRHDGLIGFISEKGNGSVFTFALPVAVPT